MPSTPEIHNNKRFRGSRSSGCHLNKKQLVFETTCSMKISLVEHCLFIGTIPYFPALKMVNYTSRGAVVYTCKYLAPFTKSGCSNTAWQDYKVLRRLKRTNMFLTGAHEWKELFSGCTDLSYRLRRALCDYLDNAANYNYDVCFECNPANLKLRNGSLVLNDCFFVNNNTELLTCCTPKQELRALANIDP